MQELQNIALSRSQGQLMVTLLKICCGGGQWFGVLFFGVFFTTAGASFLLYN